MSVPPAVRAFIGLGGNQGEVAASLDQALMALDALPQTRLLHRSAYYRTPAWGQREQPDFLNAVAEVQTGLAPRVLLDALLAIEARFGRQRSEDTRWGPRPLDLDLLLYADAVLDAPGLHLPHPRLHERAFVLVPLAEIAADLQVPGRGRVADLLATVDRQGIEVAA